MGLGDAISELETLVWNFGRPLAGHGQVAAQ